MMKTECRGDKHGQCHGGGKNDNQHDPVLLASTTDDARFGFIEDEEDCLTDPEALLASPFICGSLRRNTRLGQAMATDTFI
jgi:hypothetical protein